MTMNLHIAGRCDNVGQTGTLLKIARRPAALHQYHALFARQAQRRQHPETRPPLHLAVVQKHRGLRHPLPLQLHVALQQGSHATDPGPLQVAAHQYRHLLARDQHGLQGLLLRGTR